MVETSLPQFRYQIQLASGKVEERIQSKEQVKTFLNALYGGKGPNGEIGFDVRKGALFYNLPKLKNTSLMSEEMLDFYAEQYARKGMHGTCKARRRPSCDPSWLTEELSELVPQPRAEFSG